MVNEFRAGYNYDNSKRQSTFTAADVASQLGLENAPSLGHDRLGFPSFQFTGPTSRPVPTSIADAQRNVDRTLRQNAFSLSDNLTWIKSAHSLKAGGLWTRNMANGRVRLRREFPGAVSIPRRWRDGESVHRFSPRRTVRCSGPRDQPRGALDGHSNDIATFVQDDWKLNKNVTLFLGLRYEIVGAWHEKGRHACELPAG